MRESFMREALGRPEDTGLALCRNSASPLTSVLKKIEKPLPKTLQKNNLPFGYWAVAEPDPICRQSSFTKEARMRERGLEKLKIRVIKLKPHF